MPKMHITRSKQINAPIQKVYDIIADLGQWQKWSPWLIMDKQASVNVRDDKKYYSWEGKRVGAGEMTVSSENNKDNVQYDLTFLKPWKSKAKVGMQLKEKDGGTEVTWLMDSSLPWFMFWMKKSMEAFVGHDYERGLNLLKDYAQDGKVHSQINHLGISEYPGCDYVAYKRSCSMDEMPKKMEADFTKLMTWAHHEKHVRAQDAFCIYHKFDMVKKVVEYTAGVPYDLLPEEQPEGTFNSVMPKTKIYSVEHVGPYEHLGNAWSTLYTMHRNKEFKPVKAIHPFETYGNSPKDTAPKDLITRIHFAVK